MERRLCTGDQRHIGPEFPATLTTPIPSMTRNDIVLPVAGMAIFLVPGRSLWRARLSDDHGCR